MNRNAGDTLKSSVTRILGAVSALATVVGWLAVVEASSPRLRAQEAVAAFEVASIKRNTADDTVVMISSPPGGKFSTIGSTLEMLLQYAYQLQDFQIVSGPAWMKSERYNIEAKAAGNAQKEQVRLMVQGLLADRFQVRLHRATKELPVFALVVGKNGPKFKAGECAGAPSPQNPCGGFSVNQRGELIGREVPISQFATKLSIIIGRTVLDKTGLAGNYDLDLKWTPEERILRASADSASDRPSIFQAVQEQLGLKLESAKGPVEVVVIDGAERPTAN